MSKELKQQQIEYSTMGLLSAYYSGCSEHMIKAYMDGLREQLGDKYTDFINGTKPVSKKEGGGQDMSKTDRETQETPGEWTRIMLDALEEKTIEVERGAIAPVLAAGDKLWEAINADNKYGEKVGVAMDQWAGAIRQYLNKKKNKEEEK